MITYYQYPLHKKIKVIHRPREKDSTSKYLPQAVRLIKGYYNFKILYDCDHSRVEYSDKLVSMKDNILSDVIIILNHYYPKNTKYLDNVDYIMDYCPKFLIDRGIIPKRYEKKLKLVDYSTVVTIPKELSNEIRNLTHQKYILAGGRTQRDYSQVVKACNKMKVKLIICDTNKYDIRETDYVKTITVSETDFTVLIQHSLFVIVPAKNNVQTPVGNYPFFLIISNDGKNRYHCNLKIIYLGKGMYIHSKLWCR